MNNYVSSRFISIILFEVYFLTKIKRPEVMINVIERKDGIYTALCPRMEFVHFSSKDKNKAVEMAKSGIDMYLKINPTFLDNVQSSEGVKV